MKEQLWGALKKQNAKGIWPYFFVLALGITLMCVAKYASGGGEKTGARQEEELQPLLQAGAASVEGETALSDYERMLEQKLAEALSKVQGVGKVQVLLTLSYKGQVELAQDITYEATQTAGSGGDEKSLTEKKESKHVIITGSDGKMSPIVIKHIEPRIEGAVIIAEGGSDPNIKASLTKAAGALLNLPAHKIEILKMNNAQ